MPELPEVETIKLGLEKKILGKTLKRIQVLSPKSFLGDPKDIKNKKVKKIWRRAKILGIDLDGKTLLFHLKMSGQIIVQSAEFKVQSGDRLIGGHPTEDMLGEMPHKHTRVIFEFSDKSKLYFNDQRKFGWIKISEKGKVQSEKSLIDLGPEPLEKKFTWKLLKQNLLKHKSMPIKVVIMDQKVVSGIGNIYANEACFEAKLDPIKRVGDMGDREFKAIHQGVIRVIKEGIKFGGSTRAHFVDPEGKKGYFLDYAKVYWKNDRPCPRCKTSIQKIQLGGRGTYFCPKCQK